MLGKKRNYSLKFKLNVIQTVKNGQFFVETSCLYFGIANQLVIIRWLQVFEKKYKWLNTQTWRFLKHGT
ncbi:hypothetical protein CEB51_08420 [Haemophilus influenzae]|nr:hypothetical protein CEB51_08420 [Haemophilus influenzae]